MVTNPESFGYELYRELQSAQGKISYLGKFHEADAKKLKSKRRDFVQSIR